MIFDQNSYGARIKKLRLAIGLTQEQLAEKVGVSRTCIVKIENGAQSGSIELAVEFAELFRTSLNFLLLGSEYRMKNKKQNLRSAIAFLSELEEEL